MTINVYARDSTESFEEKQMFIRIFKPVLLEERGQGARRYFVLGDYNVDLELSRMEDTDDLKEIYGAQIIVWY